MTTFHTDGVKMVYAENPQAWRTWLRRNHAKEKAVWLVYYKPASGKKRVSYNDAVDEAICFGWIDSKPAALDAMRSLQYFSKRNPSSNWSSVNRKRALRLIRQHRMAAAGLKLIEQAKRNGSWTALKEVDDNVIPGDLAKKLRSQPVAMKYFMAFPKSSKKNILEWIHNAKRPETRLKRIQQTVDMAQKNLRANHYRQVKNVMS